jgi:carboxypeptidase family protein
MRSLTKGLAILVLLLLPATVFAQATITGTVKDASGAVLPGVTVEASSPALIEKTRTAVTDGTGQYRIINLQPGTYGVTFTLTGFTTVKRDGIELTGTFVATVNADMKVGALAETITVTGETPVVDVQSAKREIVMNQSVIQTLPATRAAGAILNATPGLIVDTNGPALSPTMTFFNAHSAAQNAQSVVGEGRMAINGMTVAAARSGGVSSYIYDTVNSQEVAITVGGGLGESDIGGPVANLIPKSGGNTFKGTGFISGSGSWSSGNNLTSDLTALNPNLTQPAKILKQYDGSVSFGGPIKKDRLWFYGSYRNLSTQTVMDGIVANANAGDASRWDWVGSPISARLVQDRQMVIGRATAQAGKSRFTYNYEYQHRCEGTPLKIDTPGCHNRGSDWIGLGNNSVPFMSPEATSTAARGYFDAPYFINQGSWSMPVTSKLLLDAGYTAFRYNPLFGFPPPDGITTLIPVTELSNAVNPATGLPFAPVASYRYRGVEQWGWAVGKTDGWQASAAYVTGAHSIKIGYQGNRLDQLDQTLTDADNMSYQFNRGVPTAVTYWLPDFGHRTLTNLQGLYAQDSWTRGRLTLQGALRWDRASSYSPVEGNGTTRLSQFNTQPYSFPVVTGVNAYNDLTPRVGVAYDVFGTGKTAVKFNWGRYVAYGANDAPYTSSNPAVTIQSNVTNRGWTDGNGNKIVDCNLNNPALNVSGGDTCAALTGNNINFGKANATTIVDPAMLSGWGVRPGDQQATILFQQEIIPRLSGDFSFTHRTFHGFFVTDDLNRNVNTAYETYTLTAPVDPRLPNGGGYPVTVYTVTAAAGPTPAKTFQTLETNIGPERDSHWNGFDINLNSRLRSGLIASIGTSTGRAVVDTCGVVTKYNNVGFGNVETGPDPRGCHNVDPFQTTIRGLASYTVPKVDVLVSATVRSQPPLQLNATWQVPNAVIAAALGHLPFAALATGNTNINLIDNSNKLFTDNRRTQIDMRFAKVLRFGHTRSDVGIDLFNLFNTNYPTAYNGTYVYNTDNTPRPAGWATPTSLYVPRFIRINYTLDF